jgi:excinuclease ABC subunit A
MSKTLSIRGANEHNLKNVSVEIPRDELVVLTGVSGSGKSSLAFDTIFKEGQRRYVESLSSYARQFIGQMQKPAVEHIEGLSPAICIDQKTVNRNPRSTVGTTTEILDHLRLLFARLGEASCPECGEQIEARTSDQIAQRMFLDFPNDGNGQELSCLILAPVVRRRKGEYRAEQEEWRDQGFRQCRINGELWDLAETKELARYEIHTLEPVIDRIRLEEKSLPRLREGIEKALAMAEGVVSVLVGVEAFEGKGEYHSYSATRACPNGHIELPELEPRCFSFNHPNGMCPTCKGLGVQQTFEEDLLVPDPSKSLEDRALRAITDKGTLMFSDWGPRELKAIAKEHGFTLSTPWKDIPLKGRKAVLHHGLPARGFKGAIPVLQALYDQWHISLLTKYMSKQGCPDCHGTRLGPVSRAVKFRGKGIHELTALSLVELKDFFEAVTFDELEVRIGREILREIRARLLFLDAVGLGYLSLERSAATLSGGEAQRIRLAAQVGAGLQGVLYVLDEPSIGLHPRDNQRLLSTLRRLRDQGNSVLVVEHDEETMREADQVIDIGPGAGALGGSIMGQGTAAELEANPASHTGDYLSRRKRVPMPATRRAVDASTPRLALKNCRSNNLKNLDVEIPLGRFVAIAGVSGSGKSTLVDAILAPALLNRLHKAERDEGLYDSLEGIEALETVVEIDQSPIGRTPRSNPATYTGVFDEIRKLFAALPEAKARGYEPGRFSFNVKGGRCEDCQGSGVKEIEMQLMANVEVECEECGGKRFNAPTLEVHYKGKTISDILDMTIGEALPFFEAHPKIRRGIAMLSEIGLDYIKLGQPSTTLSGGEAQRIKLATELQKPSHGKSFYLLDEPTTGLHFEDVERLLNCLQQLVERGNTVVVIEHNLDLVRAADWVLELGPEGGAAGGLLLATGTPEQVAANPASLTAPYLAAAIADGNAEPHSLEPAPLAHAAEPVAVDLDIRIRGACKHNLKNATVRIPRHSFTVITGPSGSGKTSLAFDTLFAEGQRRFVESLSTYARRFLGRMDRAEAEAVEGLSPAIAIDQKTASRSPRSTVATLTEIYDYLRLLWARAGTLHDPKTNEILRGYSPAEMADAGLKAAGAGQILSIWAPAHIPGSNLPLFLQESSALPRVASQLMELGFETALVDGKEIDLRECPAVKNGKRVDLKVDRVKVSPTARKRTMEAVLRSREHAHGMVRFNWEKETLLVGQFPVNEKTGHFQKEDWEPRHFSFNSHFGACPECEGLGVVGKVKCPVCLGERLRPETRVVRVGGKRLPEIVHSSVDDCLEFFSGLKLEGSAKAIATPILRELVGRLKFLAEVGVGYLALDRAANTLSGGEAQRIRLASQIGSGLEGVMYVLDEPTTGLHQSDTAQLVTTLKRLRDLGNTVITVEHDPELIGAADHVIDMGPGAGEEGGEVVASGTLAEILTNPVSKTSAFLSGRERIGRDKATTLATSWIRAKGVSLRTLESLNIEIPQGRMTGICGVSGSGKSTLALDLLVPALEAQVKGKKTRTIKALSVDDPIAEVVVVDQAPIGTTPRSNPASYTHLWDHVRDLFADLPESKLRGWGKYHFSFNGGTGRCPVCEGRGFIELEMHFLSDVWVRCEACNGRRFPEKTLEIKFRGKSVSDILEMRVDQALPFFSFHKKAKKILEVLDSLGLGYLRLGQPATQLSGGEAQRLKIAEELARNRRGRALYLLDEPTTGLHLSDVQLLVQALSKLVDRGDTVVVVEHQLDLLDACDWLLELGPGGGPAGGKLLYQGPPTALSARTPTGKALSNYRKSFGKKG